MGGMTCTVYAVAMDELLKLIDARVDARIEERAAARAAAAGGTSVVVTPAFLNATLRDLADAVDSLALVHGAESHD